LKSPDRQTVLVIDDSPVDIAVLSEILRQEYSVLGATSATTALEMLHSTTVPDLILLDVLMPGVDGLALCQKLHADPATRQVPVIFVTSKDTDEGEAAGFAVGGVDYVVKPVNPHLLRARVRAHVDLKLAREELESQNSVLKENARLREEVEHLTRHDLKNPLMVILNIPAILMRRPGIGAEEVKWLQMILASGRRMLEIINMSTGMFKMEQGSYVPHPEPVDALGVAHQIVEALARLASRDSPSIEVILESRPALAADSFMVHAEEPLLYTMLSNLVRNAVEASPVGGHVSVAFSRDTCGVIAIHNAGSIPAGIQERFFEKFVTSGKPGGTGLGAYSARLIARTLGGEINCKTSDEAGTTLTVNLPLPPAEPRAPG
jgi:signal transduction histidine kinase